MYFVISNGDEGIVIETMDEAELLDNLGPWDEGEGSYWGNGDGDVEVSFLDVMPQFSSGYFKNTPSTAILIVKGEIVIPRLKSDASAYEL